MVNYLAILAATAISYIIPMLWYSVIFGKQWMKLMNVKKDKNMKMGASTIVLGLLATLILNYVLAVFIGYSGASSFIAGAIIGAVLWIGFIATTMFNGVLYERRPFALYLLNSVVYLISMVVAGGILAVWN